MPQFVAETARVVSSIYQHMKLADNNFFLHRLVAKLFNSIAGTDRRAVAERHASAE